MLFLPILVAVLKRSETGEVFEDTIEGLVGGKAAERHGVGNGLVVGIIFVRAEDGLRVLHAVTGYVLRETETRAAVDAVGYIGAVGADGVSEVLDSERRIREKLLLA